MVMRNAVPLIPCLVRVMYRGVPILTEEFAESHELEQACACTAYSA